MYKTKHTLKIGSTWLWNTLLDRPCPERGFSITSNLGGLLHFIYGRSYKASVTTRLEVCFLLDIIG